MRMNPGCLQPVPFVGQGDFHSEISALLQVLLDLPRKMVHVEDDLLRPIPGYVPNSPLKEGHASHLDQCLGLLVGQGFKPGADAGGEEHCFHRKMVRYEQYRKAS